MERMFPEGLVGKKLGMTQVFTDDGKAIPVTAIQVGPCYVLQIKTVENDGYSAVQLGFEPKKPQRVDRALTGHFSKAEKGAFYYVKEVRCDVEKLGWTELGKELNATDVFSQGLFVDVSGISIGRGFSGVFKKFGVKGQPATRGTHEVRRHIGSIGCRKFPGRVFKNKKMPGQFGNENVTIVNLEIVAVHSDKNVILVKGGVPGAKGSYVVVKKAKKRTQKEAA